MVVVVGRRGLCVFTCLLMLLSSTGRYECKNLVN